MSFILDALKKSENARQRQIGPAMAELPRRRRQSERPMWAFVVAGLLLVNIGVLGLVLSRKKGGDVQPVSAAAAAPIGNTAMQQQLPPATTMLPAREPMQLEPEPLQMPQAPGRNFAGASSLAEESGTPSDLAGDTNVAVDPAEAAMQAQVQAALAQEAPRPIQAPAVAPLANTAQPGRNVPAAPASNTRAGEILPTIDELQASGRTFPPMKLDIHSFADKPAERFVFVNMRRYNEGMTLQEGPSVERITEEGVVLNQQGLRFLLPRP
jgi:general secretion pathway protein B